jgi:hypothetical protein
MQACVMSSAKEFETYARDCVKLAEQPDAPPEHLEELPPNGARMDAGDDGG